MAEPTVTTAGSVSLTVLFVTILGPLAGPYVLIVLASVAGAMWPLTAARTMGRAAGAWLLVRCATTALVLTGLLAGILERSWGLPLSEGLAPVALFIGAMGYGWRPVFASLSAMFQGWVREGGRR